MADVSVTIGNVVVPITAPVDTGLAGEAVTTLDVVYLNSSNKWVKAADDVLDSVVVGVVVSGPVAADQFVSVCRTPGTLITSGATHVQKDLLVISPTNAGKIAPPADLGVSDTLYLVAVAISTTQIKLLLRHTGA